MRESVKISYPVSQWQQLGYSDKRIALNCIKEWIVGEMESLRQDIDHETKFAGVQKVPPYLISIFKNKLEERKEFLNHLLQDVFNELNNSSVSIP